MDFKRILVGSLVSVALSAAPLSPALAGWHHHGGRGFRGPFGLVGALIGGAAVLATLPIAALASAGPSEDSGEARGYSRYDNGQTPSGYSDQQSYSYPPSRYSRNRQGYEYAGAPRGYGPDRSRYNVAQQSQSYTPRDRYGEQDQAANDEDLAGYGPPQQARYYGPSNYYDSPQSYAPRPSYYGPPPGY